MSTEIKDGGPAFPHYDCGDTGVRSGMTLRDYFAARAMEGMIIHGDDPSDPKNLSKGFAIAAYEYADAMLRAREVQV